MIGERIREKRLALKIKQSELGKRIGVGKSTVSEWEHNKRKPSIEILDQIASALETTASYLMDWDREPDAVDRKVLEIDPKFVPGKSYVLENNAAKNFKHAILFKRSRALTEKQLDIVNSIVDEMVKESDE